MCTVGGRIGWIVTRSGTARRPGIPGTTTPPPSVTHDDTIARESNRPLHAQPLRPSVPLPPTLYTTSVANNALNLDDTGQPLTYATAKSGSNAPQWQIAETEELDRLLST